MEKAKLTKEFEPRYGAHQGSPVTLLWHLRILLLFALLSISPNLHSQVYKNLASALGVKEVHTYPYGFSSGVSCVDFTGDGLDDITLGSQYGDSIWFYQNTGNGFQKIPAPVVHTDYSSHVIWVDYDNDGDLDLYVSSEDQVNRLYRNDSTNGFMDVTFMCGLFAPSHPSYGASWGDINNDGWLDLYQCNRTGKNYMFLSNGNGGFVNISLPSGTCGYDRYTFASVFMDVNNDGLQDLWVVNDKYQPCELYKNNGDNTFSEISTPSGTNVAMDGMTATTADYNNDGFLDMYITNTPIGGNKLLHNNGNETFTDMADSLGVDFHGYSWAAQFFDYNNDGDLDLYISEKHFPNAKVSRSLRDYNGFDYSPAFAGFSDDTLKSHSNALGDFNMDGVYDIVSPNMFPDSLQLWQSLEGDNGWVKLRLKGTLSNIHGIGSWITGYADTDVYRRYTVCGSGFLSQNSFTEIIGVGTHPHLDSLEVKWLSGHTDMFYRLDTSQVYVLEEGSSFAAELARTGDTVFCAGDSINISLSTKKQYHSYLWSTGDTTPGISVQSPGMYYVTVADSFGFTAVTDSFSVAVDSFRVTGSFRHDSLNTGTGWAKVTTISGIPPYNYLWSHDTTLRDSLAAHLTQGIYSVLVTDSLGCSDSVSFEILNPLSTEEREFGASVFPNPASGKVEITWPNTGSLSFQLINAAGKTVRAGQLHRPYQLSLQNLPEGVYQLSLQPDENTVVTKRLVVVKH